MDKEIVKSMREAIKQGNLDLVKKLNVNNEGLLNADTIFGSWLHVASAHGQINIVKYLIKCGLDVNRNGDLSGGTPVRSAAEHGHLDIVKLLYKKEAKFDVSKARKNPLFAAIYGGHYEVAKFLIDKGIDLTASYSIGKLENVDAYEYARQFGQLEIADYIKEKLEVKKVH